MEGPKNCLIHIPNYRGPNVANKLSDRFKSRDDLCLLVNQRISTSGGSNCIWHQPGWPDMLQRLCFCFVFFASVWG